MVEAHTDGKVPGGPAVSSFALQCAGFVSVPGSTQTSGPMAGRLRAVAQKALPRLKRPPTLLPNFDIRLLPLSKEATNQLEKEGWCREAAFRTKPHVTKQEIRGILEGMYGLNVSSVQTINYEGKKKRDKYGFYRRPDWKKAYVVFKNPAST